MDVFTEGIIEVRVDDGEDIDGLLILAHHELAGARRFEAESCVHDDDHLAHGEFSGRGDEASDREVRILHDDADVSSEVHGLYGRGVWAMALGELLVGS